MAHHAALWVLCVTAVVLLHIPFLTLPYYWDEAGYYFPAALELARHGRLIPQTTAANPHPPLLSLYLATAYKLFGPSPLVTRLAMCVVTGTALYAVLLVAMQLIPAGYGLWAASLFALSPLAFAQSTLAHLDMAATAATLLAVFFYLRGNLAGYLFAGSALCLVRETGAAVIVLLAVLGRRPLLLLPLAPLAGWFIYLRIGTGHWLGDPGFVAYNVWQALDPLRFLTTLARRLHFLLWVDFRWLLALPAAWLLLARGARVSRRAPNAALLLWRVLGVQILVVSLFGGAILNRYLLPALALFFLLCVEVWNRWEPAGRFDLRKPALAVLLLAQIGCWFWNPPYPFPFEENLAYADFVSLHRAAAERVPELAAGSRILTAWPATDELRRPELGYVTAPLRVVALEDFSEASFARFAAADFDYVLLFSRDYEPPWNLLERVPWLETIRRQVYKRKPAAKPEWVRARFDLLSLGAIHFRGQWIEWLARADLKIPPRRPVVARRPFPPAGSGTSSTTFPAP
jgi:hypothetical protein